MCIGQLFRHSDFNPTMFDGELALGHFPGCARNDA
jgi:hypothetical protein